MLSRCASLQGGKEAVKEIYAVWRMAGTKTCARYVGGILRHLPSVIRQQKLAPADTAIRGELRFCVMGCDLRLDGEYFSGARELWGRQVYFMQPGFSIARGDVIVDLGANVGLFSLLAAKIGARVLAVEMQSGLLPLIESNLKANGVADAVKIVWGVIASGSGIAADHSIRQTASHYFEPAPELSMMQLIRSHAIKRIDFLKIDIEGSEFDLFSTSSDWLGIVRKVAMEVHCRFGDAKMLSETLRGAGFEVAFVENRGSVVPSFTTDGGYLFAWRT